MPSHNVKEQVRAALGRDDDRLPPHSQEAEEQLIGAALLDPALMPTLMTIIRPEDFFIVRLEWVWRAMIDVYTRTLDLDVTLLAEVLRDHGQLDEIGGAAHLTWLLNARSGIDAEALAQLVQRAADRRALLNLAGQLAGAALDGQQTVMTVYTEQLQAFIDAKPRAFEQALTPGSSIIDRFLALQSRDAGAVKVFPLPFGDAGEGLPFFTAGKLFGIGGDEKTGKSALAETLAEHWALLGKRGFFIHTEEKPDDKILRRYARYSRIPFLRLEAGQLTAAEIEQRGDAISHTLDWQDRLDLWHESLPTPDSVMALMLRAIQVFRVDFIVLDNFTDVDFGDDRQRTVPQQALRLLQRLDDLAARHNVLIVITTQMSTQESGKRIAYGTSAFAKKCSWFWDINRTTLNESLTYSADGATHTLQPGAFDPRVDIFVPASRYSSGAKIKVFADLRRFYWRERREVRFVEAAHAEPDDDVYRGGD